MSLIQNFDKDTVCEKQWFQEYEKTFQYFTTLLCDILNDISIHLYTKNKNEIESIKKLDNINFCRELIKILFLDSFITKELQFFKNLILKYDLSKFEEKITLLKSSIPDVIIERYCNIHDMNDEYSKYQQLKKSKKSMEIKVFKATYFKSNKLLDFSVENGNDLREKIISLQNHKLIIFMKNFSILVTKTLESK